MLSDTAVKKILQTPPWGLHYKWISDIQPSDIQLTSQTSFVIVILQMSKLAFEKTIVESGVLANRLILYFRDGSLIQVRVYCTYY